MCKWKLVNSRRHIRAPSSSWWAVVCCQKARRLAALIQQDHSTCSSSPFKSLPCQHRHWSIRIMLCPSQISCWFDIEFLYLECVTMNWIHLHEILIGGPWLLAVETWAHAGLYKQRWKISQSEWAHTAWGMGLPASATKSFLGPGQIFKRENKMLCWLLTQKIITSALSHSTLFSRLGGQCLTLAEASVRYEWITCCWFIVILAGREYSKLDYCWRRSELILLRFYWWCAKL